MARRRPCCWASGAKIYGVDVRKEAPTSPSHHRQGRRHCVTRAVDMTKAKEVEAAVADCMKKFGRIDVLVNNVGGSAPGNAATMSEEVWTRRSATPQDCLPGLQVRAADHGEASKGAIVNLASVAGLRMTPDRAHVPIRRLSSASSRFPSRRRSRTPRRESAATRDPGLMHTGSSSTACQDIAANDLQGL